MKGVESFAMNMDDPRGEHSSSLELASAASKGDQSAQREIVLKLVNRVGTTVRCLTPGDPNTEDYVQDVLIEILGSLGSYRGESSIQSWAERITVRVAMRKIKQRSWRSKIVLLDSEREGVADCSRGDEALSRRQVWNRIVAALKCLDQERRLVVVLKLVLGYSTEEISKLTEMKFNTVKDRLAKGRKRLRQELLGDPALEDIFGKKGVPR